MSNFELEYLPEKVKLLIHSEYRQFESKLFWGEIRLRNYSSESLFVISNRKVILFSDFKSFSISKNLILDSFPFEGHDL